MGTAPIVNDYAKYRLKSEQEIIDAIREKDNLFVIACKKCYQEFQIADSEPNLIVDMLNNHNKKTISCLELDFLCNSYLNNKKILDELNKYLDVVDAVCIISCGIGIQNVAELVKDRDIFSFADSISHKHIATAPVVYHGISLNSDSYCAACGQCYLNYTNNICPITECSKSLLNGPCGGSTSDRCEIDKNRDCGWKKILAQDTRQDTSHIIHIRDYNKTGPGTSIEHITYNLENRLEGFYGGIHPEEHKEITENLAIVRFAEPQNVAIFLSQHIGSPAQPVVKIEDKVFMGQIIAESTGAVSANIHSSISGKVIDIKEVFHPTKKQPLPAIIIENDMEERLDPSIIPVNDWQHYSSQQLIDIITQKGIVGLGGAMFPTSIKLSPAKPIDTLIINGCECEPYLNADNRLMINYPEEFLEGVRIIKKVLMVEDVLIAIEDNKPEAMRRIEAQDLDGIKVIQVKTKYPQGAERMLINRLLGRRVPLQGLPMEVGVVVQNVGTAYAIYEAVVKGMPLIKRIITVAGEYCTNHGNYEIKIGTPIKDIINYCFSSNLSLCTLKMGGAMMGIELEDIDTAVIKGTSGIISVKRNMIEPEYSRNCIRCGRCVDVCPMELEPLYFALYYQQDQLKELGKYNVRSCIECGCCEYICASKIPLVNIIKKGKLIC